MHTAAPLGLSGGFFSSFLFCPRRETEEEEEKEEEEETESACERRRRKKSPWSRLLLLPLLLLLLLRRRRQGQSGGEEERGVTERGNFPFFLWSGIRQLQSVYFLQMGKKICIMRESSRSCGGRNKGNVFWVNFGQGGEKGEGKCRLQFVLFCPPPLSAPLLLLLAKKIEEGGRVAQKGFGGRREATNFSLCVLLRVSLSPFFPFFFTVPSLSLLPHFCPNLLSLHPLLFFLFLPYRGFKKPFFFPVLFRRWGRLRDLPPSSLLSFPLFAAPTISLSIVYSNLLSQRIKHHNAKFFTRSQTTCCFLLVVVPLDTSEKKKIFFPFHFLFRVCGKRAGIGWSKSKYWGKRKKKRRRRGDDELKRGEKEIARKVAETGRTNGRSEESLRSHHWATEGEEEEKGSLLFSSLSLTLPKRCPPLFFFLYRLTKQRDRISWIFSLGTNLPLKSWVFFREFCDSKKHEWIT